MSNETIKRIAIWGGIAAFLIAGMTTSGWPLALVLFIILFGYKTYEFLYFRSSKFQAIKNRISMHVQDCNNLNDHIERLKATHIGVNMSQRGQAQWQDASRWNYKRSELGKSVNAPNVYTCSREIVAAAQRDPIKYVCKYFGFQADERTLEQFETMLNNFTAAEDGKVSLSAEKAGILNSIVRDIPWPIKQFSKRQLDRKLGFRDVRLNDMFYPWFRFQYVSSGGNASTQSTFVLNIPNLNNMVAYLNSRIRWKKSVAGQRALMTSALRRHILERDGFRCRMCGIGLDNEPHLLLEVDHIIPVSRGGLTAENNLQTLCWRCNRSKGAKIAQSVSMQS